MDNSPRQAHASPTTLQPHDPSDDKQPVLGSSVLLSDVKHCVEDKEMVHGNSKDKGLAESEQEDGGEERHNAQRIKEKLPLGFTDDTFARHCFSVNLLGTESDRKKAKQENPERKPEQKHKAAEISPEGGASKNAIGIEKNIFHSQIEQSAVGIEKGPPFATTRSPPHYRELRSDKIEESLVYRALVRDMVSRKINFDGYFPRLFNKFPPSNAPQVPFIPLSIQTPLLQFCSERNNPSTHGTPRLGEGGVTFTQTLLAESRFRADGAFPRFPIPYPAGHFDFYGTRAGSIDPRSGFFRPYRLHCVDAFKSQEQASLSKISPVTFRNVTNSMTPLASYMSSTVQEKSLSPRAENQLPSPLKRKLSEFLSPPQKSETKSPSFQRSDIPRKVFSASVQQSPGPTHDNSSDRYLATALTTFPTHHDARQLPKLLALPSEESICVISPYQLLVRKQIEVFEATATESVAIVKGRKKPIAAGQVGMRCRHCSGVPLHLRQRGSVYFPSNLDGLYQAGQHMANFHLTDECSSMPRDVKEQFSQILATKSKMGGGKKYWREAAMLIGLVDTADGIRFVGSTINKSRTSSRKK